MHSIFSVDNVDKRVNNRFWRTFLTLNLCKTHLEQWIYTFSV